MVPFVLILAAFFSWGVISLDQDKQFKASHKIEKQCERSADVQEWTKEFQDGKLSKRDLDFLMKGRQSLCKYFYEKQK